jgi:hypothetical protein
LPIADVNDDGKEEILWGEHCIGENGRDLWVIEERMPYSGHPDVVIAADILPSNEGKEIYYCREGWGGRNEKIGMLLADREGKVIWARWGHTHVDKGWVAKILPHQPGLQCYGLDVQKKVFNKSLATYRGASSFLWSADGTLIGHPPESWIRSYPIDWDGDGIREILMTNGELQKYDGTIIAELGAGPLWGADLFGDHREEVVLAPGDGKVHIVFNTQIMKAPARVALVADRQYRNDLSRTAMGGHRNPTEGGFVPRKHGGP